LGALAKDLGQRVPARGWKRDVRCGNFLHGGVLLGNWVLEQTKFKPKYAAFFNSSSTTSGYISGAPKQNRGGVNSGENHYER
jgi:hypothetical protein